MDKNLKYFLVIAFVFIFVIVLKYTTGMKTNVNLIIQSSNNIEANEQEVSYKLISVDRKFSVNSGDLNGKVVFINFWSTSCGFCIKDLYYWDKLSGYLKKNNLLDKTKILFFTLDNSPNTSGTVNKINSIIKSYTNFDNISIMDYGRINNIYFKGIQNESEKELLKDNYVIGKNNVPITTSSVPILYIVDTNGKTIYKQQGAGFFHKFSIDSTIELVKKLIDKK